MILSINKHEVLADGIDSVTVPSVPIGAKILLKEQDSGIPVLNTVSLGEDEIFTFDEIQEYFLLITYTETIEDTVYHRKFEVVINAT